MTDINDDINTAVEKVVSYNPTKIIISNPVQKSGGFRKIVLAKKPDSSFAAEKLTDMQAFHESVKKPELKAYLSKLFPTDFRQLNAWVSNENGNDEYGIKVSKKGKYLLSKSIGGAVAEPAAEHNRRKNYILPEGRAVPVLVDMGVMTKDGGVNPSMYDKFRQVNRFLEIIEDAYDAAPLNPLNIVDFGCGKAYLTFALYYYFSEIKKINVNILGLDIKRDVIAKCNAAAQKYGYGHLRFEHEDITGYNRDFPIDMAVALHACDTATDCALSHAVKQNAAMIFCAPCCQHELNGQIRSERLSILTKYGILKERTAAALTDAIRANILTCCGYKTQLLEFVDMEHTAKNIMLRAVKRNIPSKVKKEAYDEIISAVNEFGADPALLRLLRDKIDGDVL